MRGIEALETRARRVRSRAAVRAWEYRQRRYSKGVWFRLRRLLADTRACWVIEQAEVERLEREGRECEPVGLELAPPRKLFVLPEERVRSMSECRQIRVELSADLLTADGVVLVRFRS